MKKAVLLVALLFLIVNIQAQDKELFELFDVKQVEDWFTLTPKGESNPFKGGKKEGLYSPNPDWITPEINRILKSSFTERQIEELSNAKISLTVYGNSLGEIKYAEFRSHKEHISDFSPKVLHRFYEQIIQIKALEGKISIEPKDAEFFKLYTLINVKRVID